MARKAQRFWLMKSEPDVFSIDDLKAKRTSLWDGVRNYMARNFMMKDMAIGDLVLFYHSNANPSGVAGVAEVSALAQPDPTQFDKKSDYYDPKSTPASPRWHCVEVSYRQHFKRHVSLEDIKNTASLGEMILLQQSRLSVQPVKEAEFKTICKMGASL
jgi:predicted RNA-binding protein with PUA-like domain